MEDRWLTIREAAHYIGSSQKTLYTWMASGKLRYRVLVTRGGRRIRQADLDKLLEDPPPRSEQEEGPTPPGHQESRPSPE